MPMTSATVAMKTTTPRTSNSVDQDNATQDENNSGGKANNTKDAEKDGDKPWQLRERYQGQERSAKKHLKRKSGRGGNPQSLVLAREMYREAGTHVQGHHVRATLLQTVFP